MVNWQTGLLIILLSTGCDSPTRMAQLDEEQFFEPAYQPLSRAVQLGALLAIDEQLKAELNIN